MILHADSGGEKFVGFARQRLRLMHQQMMQWGVRLLNRRIDASDGSSIYLKSLYLGHGQFADRVRITGGGFVFVGDFESAESIYRISRGGVSSGSFLNTSSGVIQAVSAARIFLDDASLLDYQGNVLVGGVSLPVAPGGVCFADDIGNTGFVCVQDATTLYRFTDDGVDNGTYTLNSAIDTATLETWSFRVGNVYYCVYQPGGVDPLALVGYDLTTGDVTLELDVSSYTLPLVSGNTSNIYALTTDPDGVNPGSVDEYDLDGVLTGRTAELPALPDTDAPGTVQILWCVCDSTTLMAVTADGGAAGVFNVAVVNLADMSVTDVSANFDATPWSTPAAGISKP